MYKLVIQDDEGKTTVVPLIRDELTIGRKEGNTIRLTERNVSRRHARLIRQNGSITIEDLNSYNGIRVNGSRITGRCQIRETDRVQIGDYLIELKSEAHDKADTLSERTIPLERIDPHATTPVPDNVEPSDSAVATTRMSKTEAAAVIGAAAFVGAVTEPMAPLADGEPTPVVVPAPGAAPGVSPPVAPAAHTAAHARLVVLTAGFAGREIDLDKTAMVIGRTEDNDICINHRSISRHHAKVVRENGRHAIVDLQSSNGVRVNGEEYGKVELRRADVIDLGHVRLRFVESGEDFVFGRDAQAVDVVPQSSSRIAMWFALALLVVGAAVVLFLVLSGGQSGDAKGGDEGSGGAQAGTPPGAGTTAGKSAVPAATAGTSGDDGDETTTAGVEKKDHGGDTTPESAAPASDEDARVSKLLDKARKARDEEKWNEVLTAANQVLAIEKANTDATGLRDQAQSEIRAEGIYEKFRRAVANRDYTQVANLFRSLDPESMYRLNAQPEHERLKAEFIQARSREGKRLADRSRCRDQERLADEAGRVWSEARSAVLSHACKLAAPGGSSSGGQGGEATAGAAHPPGADGPGEPGGSAGESGDGAASFDELLDKSKKAVLAGDNAASLKYCEMAVEKKRSDQNAISTCAIAACKLKNMVKARKYIGKLSDADKKEQHRNLCRQNGVTDI
ncbi:MAG TPA: FHA domain-containing protein [Kofleriaceae bacterium]|nr:FHA domain-containing protein [Kofleriaceae bacterium]